MHLTMNRFKVKLGREADFEAVWQRRESHLKRVPGFLAFHLLRGSESAEYRLYASHTVWADEESFLAWTKSEAFRQAHAGAGNHKDIYLAAPELEVFDSVQAIAADP